MSIGRGFWVLVAAALLLACGGESDTNSSQTASSQQSGATATAAAPAFEPVEPSPAATASRQAPAEQTPVPPAVATPVPLDDQEDDMTPSSDNESPTPEVPTPPATPEPDIAAQDCVRLTDFAIQAENLSWFIVNDNVMGGQSSGGPTFADSAMIFEGEINTDGGGFSSVRVQLGSGALAGFTELAVRARTDGRAFKLIVEDGLTTRDRRVSQQGVLDFGASAEWQTATVRFDELEPRIFGRAVETETFRPDLATQLGIMISDGVDGPFRIEIDWIDACR